MFELNPIDVLKKRELRVLPPHFATTTITDSELFDLGESRWIHNKLKGRFCIVSKPSVDRDNKLKSTTLVGFEDSKELTYFMLACPYLRRK